MTFKVVAKASENMFSNRLAVDSTLMKLAALFDKVNS